MRVIDEGAEAYWNHLGTRRQHIVELLEPLKDAVEMLREKAKYSASAAAKQEEVEITVAYIQRILTHCWEENHEPFYRKEINAITSDSTRNLSSD